MESAGHFLSARPVFPQGRSCPLFRRPHLLLRRRGCSRGSQRSAAWRGGRSREATRVTARLGATPARGAAALPSPGRRCSSAPFVRFSDLLRPNRSLCFFFLQVPHFWQKCSRAENSCWHILPGLGEGGQGLATRLPPSALRRGRSVRAGDCGSPARQQR